MNSPISATVTTANSYKTIVPPSITDRAAWESVRQRPEFAESLTDQLRRAEQLPDLAPVPQATDFLAARRHDNRGATDAHWQFHRHGMTGLALRRCLLGLDPNDPDDKLVNWIWAMLTQASWAVAAHLPGQELPDLGQPVLDLASTEMAALFADILVTLKPWMDSISNTLATSIIHEIDRRILTPFVEGPLPSWASPDQVLVNNWSGVCAGSVLVACQSLALLGHERPEAKAKALRVLDMFIQRGFTPSGECDEGMGYWGYGVAYACMGWSRLSEDEFRANVDVERLKQVADYPRRAHLFDISFYASNDAGVKYGAAVNYIPWLANVTGNEFLSTWVALTPAKLRTSLPRHFYFMIQQFFGPSMPDVSKVEEVQHDAVTYLPDQQAAILRTPTSRGEMISILSGGHNGECHNHNDIGHFMVFADKQLIVPDLGAPHYTTSFFRHGERYKFLAASSRGHCCPIINGQEQLDGPAAAAKVLEWSPDKPEATFKVDLTAGYPPAAELKSWTREMKRQGETITITDEFITTRGGVPIEHVLWSTQEPSAVSDSGAKFGKLQIQVSPAASKLAVETVDPKPHLLREYQESLYRVAASYATDSSGKLTVVTTLSLI